MSQLLLITAIFRESGYSKKERLSIQHVFEPFGHVRLRPKVMPDAGGSAELWLVLEFIGQTIYTGVLEEIGAEALRRMTGLLNQFIRNKRDSSSKPVETQSITLSFDDIEMEIMNPSDEVITNLDVIVERARRGARQGALRGKRVTHIVISNREAITHAHDLPQSMQTDRYWTIFEEGNYTPMGIYDSENDQLLAQLLDQDV